MKAFEELVALGGGLEDLAFENLHRVEAGLLGHVEMPKAFWAKR